MSLPPSARSTLQRQRERNYQLYAVNYHGSAINSIRDEFLKRAKTGIRRKVFIIELDEEIKRTSESVVQRKSRNSKLPDVQFGGNILLTACMNAIERCRQHYDDLIQSIEKEKKFDLYTYWLEDLENRNQLGKRKSSLGGRTSIQKTAGKSAKGTGQLATVREDTTQPNMPICPVLKSRPHNRVGQKPQLSKRKYIIDEPVDSKLFIIIVGKLHNTFYRDLLSIGEPLHAIIHFLPGECGYDRLVPQPERQRLLQHILENVQSSTYGLRQSDLTKPVGILQQYLPIISNCLAIKYSDTIYSELSWYMYDVEVLRQQYEQYYKQAFHEANVAMPHDENIQYVKDLIGSLTIQGQIIKAPLAEIGTDLTTITMYLQSLLNIIAPPENLLTTNEVLMLTRPLSRSFFAAFGDNLTKLIANFASAFNSITKIAKYNRLFVGKNNQLLCSMISYADHNVFFNVFLTCLEFNLVRVLFKSIPMEQTPKYTPYEAKREAFTFPPFVKFYPTEDAVQQQLAEYTRDFEDIKIEEIYPGYKLYTFTCTYDEIYEAEQLMHLPTRLCFRDFTLFQLEEFQANLVTPEKRKELIMERLSVAERCRELANSSGDIEIDADIFIRPNSLKARYLVQKEVVLTESGHEEKPTNRKKRSKAQVGHMEGNTAESAQENVPIDYVGLPPEHPLLQGYNLEDTRQEIFTKTSKYYFEEGHIKLYQERWCFDDMNKNIDFFVNGNHLNFYQTHPKLINGISNNIYLRTKNDISVRVLADANECAKIVLNYPNALTVYYHETYAEQCWLKEDTTYNEELRRIFTPYGAIIVQFKDDDLMTLIMRYNGEVYELFQQEFEMDYGNEKLNEFTSSNLTSNITTDDSTKLGPKASTSKGKRSNTKLKSIQSDTPSLKSIKRKSRRKPNLSEITEEDDPTKVKSSTKSVKELLNEYIENELRYINYVITVYNLSYLHLRITTTIGRVINITHTGNIYETKKWQNIEWHDYFANESYAMREDGVKMIWTKDTLKCYHKDGTVFTTKTEESSETVNLIYDEFESRITESSSHERMTYSGNEEQSQQTKRKLRAKKSYETAYLHSVLKLNNTANYKDYIAEEDEEHHKSAEDTSYASFTCDSFLMQHKNYAEVFIMLLKDFTNEIRVLMVIFAADQIRIQVGYEDSFENDLLGTIETKSEDFREHNSTAGRAQSNEAEEFDIPPTSSQNDSHSIGTNDSKYATDTPIDVTAQRSFVIKLWIGDDLDLFVTEKTCEINALLQRKADEEDEPLNDALQLKFNFDANINDIFQEFITKISHFKKYSKPITHKTLFLYKEDNNCRVQGFQFYNKLPPLGEYNFSVSNTVTDFCTLQTVDERMANQYKWFTTDMKKFPRFPKRSFSKAEPIDKFPMILTVNVYCKIPDQLRPSEKIQIFLETFDKLNFKRLRYQIKETLDYYLRPRIRIELKMLISKMSWRHRHKEHQRRLFIEEQRKGLYHAMLKHKAYPKYQLFTTIFHNHVKYIDFFEFMSYKCMERPKVNAASPSTDKKKKLTRFGSVMENNNAHK